MNIIHVIKVIGAWACLLGAAVTIVILHNETYVMPLALTSIAFSLVPEA